MRATRTTELLYRAVPPAGIEPASLIRFEGPAAPVHQSNDGIVPLRERRRGQWPAAPPQERGLWAAPDHAARRSARSVVSVLFLTICVLRARFELAFSRMRAWRDDRYSNGALS